MHLIAKFLDNQSTSDTEKYRKFLFLNWWNY